MVAVGKRARQTIRLPEGELERIRVIRDAQLDGIKTAVADLDASLTADVEGMIRRMRNSGYAPRTIEREAKAFAARHEGRLAEAVAEQVQLTAGLADRYAEIVSAFVEKEAADVVLLPRAAASFQAREGARTAQAALSQDALLDRATGIVTGRKSSTDRLLERYVKPWRDVRPLSARLHGDAIATAREVTQQTLAAVRDAKNLSEAGSDLIRAVRASGKGELADGGNIPKLLRDVERAGMDLNRRGGEEALAEWRRARSELRRYMGRLAEGGRARTRVLEILQNTTQDRAKGIDSAVRRYAGDKQRYAAERILKTEQQAAFKSRQVLSDARHPSITHYIWHMNRGGRQGYVKRVKPSRTFPMGRKKGGAKRRCVCEQLDGRKFLADEAREGTRIIAHPHCMCWLEPVFDKKLMLKAESIYFEPGD